MILNFEVITPTPLVFASPDVLSDFNLQGGQLYRQSDFKRFKGYFLKKLKFGAKTT